MSLDPGIMAVDWRVDLARERTFLCVSALLFLVSAGGTIYWCRSMPGAMGMPGGWTMSMAWMKTDGQSWLPAALWFTGMWVLMMLAMMLPSLVPALLQYRRAIRWEAETQLSRSTALAAAGYFFVWAMFGVLVYPIGVSLSSLAMRWNSFARVVPQATGAVLLIAGIFQLSGWKIRRLRRCRLETACEANPYDVTSGWKYGLRLGIDCASCCAGLMAVLLVDDPMNLATMAMVTLAITAERLGPKSERAARLIGVVVMAMSAPLLLGLK